MILRISETDFIKISYSAIAFIVTVVIGAATWMTTTQLTLSDNTTSIEEIKTENEQLRDIVIRIDKNVTEINTVLKSR